MRTCLEICAGAGGQALGLESAGFEPRALIDLDAAACGTLRLNRPQWNVIQADLRSFDGHPYRGVDLLAGGVPCPPFSIAGKQLGAEDERDLFPEAMRLVREIRPKAVMLENVRGFLDAAFDPYRSALKTRFHELGYRVEWRLLNASDFGVSQQRSRVVIVAMQSELWEFFRWPEASSPPPPTVGESLFQLMASRGWVDARDWRAQANQIAPTIVGGSKKHGGPDLGPTRAKRAWANLGVDGLGVADLPPEVDFVGMPRLTVPMVARLQGFPEEWRISGRKTAAYRQVGNAFPPPVAAAVARQIHQALEWSEP